MMMPQVTVHADPLPAFAELYANAEVARNAGSAGPLLVPGVV